MEIQSSRQARRGRVQKGIYLQNSKTVKQQNRILGNAREDTEGRLQKKGMHQHRTNIRKGINTRGLNYTSGTRWGNSNCTRKNQSTKMGCERRGRVGGWGRLEAEARAGEHTDIKK